MRFSFLRAAVLALFVCTPLVVFVSGAQSAATRAASLLRGPKPPDVSHEWKEMVGVYRPGQEPRVVILERNQQLIWLENRHETAIYPDSKDPHKFTLAKGSDFRTVTDASGTVRRIECTTRPNPLNRIDAGADPTQSFQVQVSPSKPVEQLRAAALRASPRAEVGPFRAPELVELVTLDEALHLDIRYAQSNNFLSTPVYAQARAFLQRPAAEALQRALKKLLPVGYGLLIHDAYRPWYVTKIFWDATPREDHNYLADSAKGSKHNRGCAVDITLYDLATPVRPSKCLQGTMKCRYALFRVFRVAPR